MVEKSKKDVREEFRRAVLKRDNRKCVMCGYAGPHLDVHHITDRSLLPGGGYVSDNGITLCNEEAKSPSCHALAEKYHMTGTPHPGYSPDNLYAEIGSAYHWAFLASLRLKGEDTVVASELLYLIEMEEITIGNLFGVLDMTTWEIAYESCLAKGMPAKDYIIPYGVGRMPLNKD